MLGRRVKVYDGSVRSASTSPGPLPASCDVAIVGAGAAGLATAIFSARQTAHARVVLLDGARKPGAKILVSGGSRCNVTNTIVTERDFWGGDADDRPPRAARVSGERDGRVLPRDRRHAARGRRRQAVSRQQSRARRARRAAAREPTRSASSCSGSLACIASNAPADAGS